MGPAGSSVSRRRYLWGGWLQFLGGFLGLCTLFAAVVTAFLYWEERTRARWPAASAHVERCELSLYSRKNDSYYIHCSVGYRVGGDEIVSHVASRSTPSPRRVLWEPQPPMFERMQDWVSRHPQGTPIAVRYNPENPSKATLDATDMPLGNSHVSNNLKLLSLGAASSLLLLAIGRLIWPRSRAGRGPTS